MPHAAVGLDVGEQLNRGGGWRRRFVDSGEMPLLEADWATDRPVLFLRGQASFFVLFASLVLLARFVFLIVL